MPKKTVLLQITFDGEEYNPDEGVYYTYNEGNMRVLRNELDKDERISIVETLFQSDTPQIAFCNDAMEAMAWEPANV